ncbi:MAG: M1 family metallopeptidase [Chloroflexaceae bacterium]|nr:M1 family metallopeptidase [Chloroflexaceae bacterium]
MKPLPPMDDNPSEAAPEQIQPLPSPTVPATSEEQAPPAPPPPPPPADTATALPPPPTATATALPPPPTVAQQQSPIYVRPSPLDESFTQAMRSDFVGDIAAYGDQMPRYDLQYRIFPDQAFLEGKVTIEFPNRTGIPLQNVVLRLYPNFPQDAFGNGGNTRMDVTAVRVAGQEVVNSLIAQDTALMVPFSVPLQPGEWTLLELDFNATFISWEDGNWPLPSYYPMLAVFDQNEGTWRTDVTDFVDHVFAESALYSAEVTVPTGLTLLASGTTINTVPQADGTTTHTLRTGPVREFAMVVGNFESVQRQGGDTGDVLVTVYKVVGSDLDIGQVADVAATSIANYDRRFGRYPYNELEAYVFRGGYRGGWEYPGMFMLSCETHIDAGRRYVTAHEVAHQWWYNVIGNDIYRHPWLDEALAQYSGIIYAEDVAGADVAASDWEREVMQRYRPALQEGDYPIGLAIYQYPNFNVYFHTVYGKGPIFLLELRNQLGDDVFFRALQLYYEKHRYQVSQPHFVQEAFEEASGRDLQELFQLWVYGS